MEIAAFLSHDHESCSELLVSACHYHRQELRERAMDELIAFGRALERHFLLEETIVFPAFEQALGPALGGAVAPTATMRDEHQRMRAVALRLADSLAEGDSVAFFKHAQVLALAMCQHGEKEDAFLYRPLNRLPQHRRDALIEAMRAFDAGNAFDNPS